MSMIKKLELLENIRVLARSLADTFHSTRAGDHFTWDGGMNEVEDLRDALNEYDHLRFAADDGDDNEREEG